MSRDPIAPSAPAPSRSASTACSLTGCRREPDLVDDEEVGLDVAVEPAVQGERAVLGGEIPEHGSGRGETRGAATQDRVVGEVLGEEATCVVTLVDRLCHRAEIVQIEGDSYRLKEAKDRAARRAPRRPKAA